MRHASGLGDNASGRYDRDMPDDNASTEANPLLRAERQLINDRMDSVRELVGARAVTIDAEEILDGGRHA